jgi:hypothetical protein
MMHPQIEFAESLNVAGEVNCHFIK